MTVLIINKLGFAILVAAIVLQRSHNSRVRFLVLAKYCYFCKVIMIQRKSGIIMSLQRISHDIYKSLPLYRAYVKT